MHSETTYYHATATPFEPQQPLRESLEADVCIVGGGLTGISAALHLAERGLTAVLLEAERIGDGASGRNGGQIVAGYSCDMTVFERAAGREAARMIWRMGSEAIADVEERIRRHAIQADLRWGYLHAALNQRQFDGLRRMENDWRETYGYDRTRLAEREETAALTGSRRYRGGLVDDGSGHMHPLKYLFGLAAAAKVAGARLFERSRVTAIARGDRIVVSTATGEVRAGSLVLAGNAYLGGMVPEIARRIAPVTSAIAVTAPLPERLGNRILPGDIALSDCNVALDYFRKSPDSRLIFGGRASYTGRPLSDIAGSLGRRMARVYPELAGTPFDYGWHGRIAITLSRMPDFGRVGRNIYYAQGFSGHGLALTGLAGKLMAEAIAGDAGRFDVFAHLPHRNFPGGPFRTAVLALGMAWFKLRDELGL